MDDKANLDDLLEMGFIGKHEYDQRLAALTASSSQSSGSSLTTVSPLRTSAAAAAGGGGGGGGGAPFQPTDPCACSTVLCACGLQIPRCLEDDHGEVCAIPASDAFKCPLDCSAAFASRGAVANHMRLCSSYVVRCGEFEMRQLCQSEMQLSDLGEHLKEVHCSEDKFFTWPSTCPLCLQELASPFCLEDHYSRECQDYFIGDGDLLRRQISTRPLPDCFNQPIQALGKILNEKPEGRRGLGFRE